MLSAAVDSATAPKETKPVPDMLSAAAAGAPAAAAAVAAEHVEARPEVAAAAATELLDPGIRLLPAFVKQTCVKQEAFALRRSQNSELAHGI